MSHPRLPKKTVKPSRIVALFAVLLVIMAAYLSFTPQFGSKKDAAKSTDSRLVAIQTLTLKNGLQVVVIPDRNSRSTIHMVWYKVGSVDDPPGKPGLAHLVEHLTFGGTHKMPASQFHQILEKTARKQDALTTRDYTVYYQIAAPDQLAMFMALEADRMSNVAFYETSMASESKALLDERRQKDWRSVFDQRMEAALYGNHPYGSSESNRGEKIDGIQDAVGFYRQWYAPNNAIVLVSGKVTAEDIFKLAEEHYGGIPSRPLPIRRIVAVKQPAPPQNVVLEDSRTRDPIWRRSYLAPSYVAGATEDVYALQVLGSLLASGPGSRLHERLVRGKSACERSCHRL